jgi:hypothetical protein
MPRIPKKFSDWNVADGWMAEEEGEMEGAGGQDRDG